MTENPKENKEIFEFFHYRCVFPVGVEDDPDIAIDKVRPCLKTATEVHEIVPKSKISNWKQFENRVPLCSDHHFLAHKYGAKKYAAKLLEMREKLIREWKLSNTQSD